MNYTERFDRFFEDGLLTRNEWTGTDERGRKTACLLAALSKEVGTKKSADACPASVMPAWLAHLVPSIDDRTSEEFWPEMVCRFADLVHCWGVLDDAAWRRCEYRFKIVTLDESLKHFDHEKNPSVAKAIEDVKALCQRVVAGDEPTQEEWMTAAEAAAAWAARAARAARAAEAEAEAAAAWAARAARAAEAEAEAAAEAAAAWDRMTDALFNTIEEECLRTANAEYNEAAK